MKSQLFRLDFHHSVHFGDGGLMKAKPTLYADTIFSAMCIEALKMGQVYFDRLVQGVRTDQLRLSDGLPYIDGLYYVPKPLIRLELEQQGDSSVKKAVKKLEYIPIQHLEEYIKGDLDVKGESKYFQDSFGVYCFTEKTSVSETEGSMPYGVASFRYKENSGLYICVQYEAEEDLELAEELLLEVSLAGIGGKKSSGYGRFELRPGKMPAAFEQRLNGTYQKYMTLSIGIPEAAEMSGVLEGAGYRLVRRGGFIDSLTYASTFRKKREVYLMASGSVFSKRFSGELMDVSSGGSHPVYRYGKPVWLGVI